MSVCIYYRFCIIYAHTLNTIHRHDLSISIPHTQYENTAISIVKLAQSTLILNPITTF